MVAALMQLQLHGWGTHVVSSGGPGLGGETEWNTVSSRFWELWLTLTAASG